MKADIKQLNFLHIQLRSLLAWLEDRTGAEYTMTSIYRPGDDGVHGTLPVRGTDLRARDLEVGRALETLINHYWKYDPDRPQLRCAVLHGEGINLHLHIQVHPNTQFTPGGE